MSYNQAVLVILSEPCAGSGDAGFRGTIELHAGNSIIAWLSD